MKGLRAPIFALVALFFLLRYDLWQTADGHFALGLPVILTYHVLYCLVAVGVLGLAVRFAWPDHLADDLPDDVLPNDGETT
ncbi:MAG: hypothetical protein AAGE94_05435 [Acidobacteriota bacterium]